MIYVIMKWFFLFRLPIIQGGTFAFLAPVIALLDQPRFACEAPLNSTDAPVDNSKSEMSLIWILLNFFLKFCRDYARSWHFCDHLTLLWERSSIFETMP